MEKERQVISLEMLKCLPDSLEQITLDMVKMEDVGTNVVSILSSCMNCFYGEDGRRRTDAVPDIKEKCRFLLDLSWEQLNTGKWKEVALGWRYLYSYASLFKAVAQVQDHHNDLQSIVRTCDMGLLMGAPILDNILARLASCLARHIARQSSQHQNTSMRVKRHCSHGPIKEENHVPVETCPSLEHFIKEYHQPQRPVLVRAALDNWPALTSRPWSVEYLLSVAGCRTVPVEIGSKYTDETWSQKLMTLQEFVDRFVSSQGSEVGYCAQHQLLEQIVELSEDVTPPLYCYTGEDSDPDVHCWFGPAGTVSPLHFDPKDNCLTQVFGEKYVCLFPPQDSAALYPHDSHLLDNTSQVDLEKPDLVKFPLFASAQRQECLLRAGELLYIPKKWWHFVRSLSTSFSLSFWWN